VTSALFDELNVIEGLMSFDHADQQEILAIQRLTRLFRHKMRANWTRRRWTKQ